MTKERLRKSIADHNRKCLEALKGQNSALIKALCDSQQVLQTFNYTFVKDQFYANAAVLREILKDRKVVPCEDHSGDVNKKVTH